MLAQENGRGLTADNERLLQTPIISVVIATYNRSYTLRHAIESVRNSSLVEWELLVVGDACTDDTAECVSSFIDPRIRFVNLPDRCGDQSGPSNHGVALARGRYVAFLNHDDLFLPAHLETSVSELERSRADLVWAPCATAYPRRDSAKADRLCEFGLSNVPVASGYSPFGFYFASSWVFRRELAERVGPWRKAERLHIEPSQDWLFRAWRSGAVMRCLSAVTVIIVPAAVRPGCYARRESPEHEWLTRWLREDPRSREFILENIAVKEATHALTYRVSYPAFSIIRRLLLRPIYGLLIALDINPLSLRNAILHRGRGKWIRTHRKLTGAR